MQVFFQILVMIDSAGDAQGESPDISKSASKAAAMAARKANSKKVRALEILKKDTGILESSIPCKVIFLIHLISPLFPPLDSCHFTTASLLVIPVSSPFDS